MKAGRGAALINTAKSWTTQWWSAIFLSVLKPTRDLGCVIYDSHARQLTRGWQDNEFSMRKKKGRRHHGRDPKERATHSILSWAHLACEHGRESAAHPARQQERKKVKLITSLASGMWNFLCQPPHYFWSYLVYQKTFSSWTTEELRDSKKSATSVLGENATSPWRN